MALRAYQSELDPRAEDRLSLGEITVVLPSRKKGEDQHGFLDTHYPTLRVEYRKDTSDEEGFTAGRVPSVESIAAYKAQFSNENGVLHLATDIMRFDSLGRNRYKPVDQDLAQLRTTLHELLVQPDPQLHVFAAFALYGNRVRGEKHGTVITERFSLEFSPFYDEDIEAYLWYLAEQKLSTQVVIDGIYLEAPIMKDHLRSIDGVKRTDLNFEEAFQRVMNASLGLPEHLDTLAAAHKYFLTRPEDRRHFIPEFPDQYWNYVIPLHTGFGWVEIDPAFGGDDGPVTGQVFDRQGQTVASFVLQCNRQTGTLSVYDLNVRPGEHHHELFHHIWNVAQSLALNNQSQHIRAVIRTRNLGRIAANEHPLLPGRSLVTQPLQATRRATR